MAETLENFEECEGCPSLKTNVPRTEHDCRLQNPDNFFNDSFVRKDVTSDGPFKGRPLTVILARPVSGDEGTLEAQSLRYPIESWTAAEARKHCKDAEKDPEQIEKFVPAQPKGNSRHLRGTLGSTSGPTRRVFQGENHIVVPVVGLVEKVMTPANNPTPEFVPSEEIEGSVLSWNGRPVVISHPERHGQATLANQPDIFEQDAVGFLFNSRFEDGKLKFDAWVNEDKAQRLGGEAKETVEALARGEVVEVSTGLIPETEPKSGVHNGQRFHGIWRNITPDHLAILPPGQKGACSVEHGCGANRLNQDGSCACGENCSCKQTESGSEMTEKVRANEVNDEARRPDFERTSTEEWSRPDFQDFVAGFFKFAPESDRPEKEEVNTTDDLNAAMKSWFASKSLLGNADAETFDDLTFFPVVNPRTNALVRNALLAVVSGRGAQAEIEQDAKESAMNMARQLLREEFNEEVDDGEEKENATHTDEMGGRNKKKKNNIQQALENEGIKEPTVLSVGSKTFTYAVNGSGRLPTLYVSNYSIQDDGSVKLSALGQTKEKFMEKQQKVEKLVANSDQFSEQDREQLEALSDSALDGLLNANQQQKQEPTNPDFTELVANADRETRESFEFGKKWLRSHRDKLKSAIKANKANPYSDEQLEEKSTDELEALAALSKPDVDYSAQGSVRTVEGEPKPKTNVAPKPKTLDDVLQTN